MVGDIFLNFLCPPPTFSNVCCRLWLCFMYLCKNGNTPSIFKHIYTLKPINKYTARSKNILFKSLCKKPFAKFKLSYRGSLLWNEFFAPNNDLLEAVTMGYLYFPAPDPLIDPRPWPWPPICIYRPWHQICIYRLNPAWVCTYWPCLPNLYLLVLVYDV